MKRCGRVYLCVATLLVIGASGCCGSGAMTAAIQPATSSQAWAAAPVIASSTPQENELRNLKMLSDAGVISEEMYLQRRREIQETTPGSKAITKARSLRNYVILDPHQSAQ